MDSAAQPARHQQPPALRFLADYGPLLLAIAVGLALRLLRIGLREAWLDEACTSVFAQLSGPGELLERLVPESHPPLYYLFMWAWVRTFGAGEVALRLPSLLAGLALIPLCWQAARAFGGGRLGASLAAGAAALSPLLVHYSVEAKAYTLLWALGAALLILLRRASEGDGRRFWWWAAIVTIVALYTHHFALFLLPLWVLALLAAEPDARSRGGLALGLSLLAWLPWAAGFLAGQAEAGGTDWLGTYWTGVGPALLGSARTMALMTPFPVYLGELGRVSLPDWSAWVVAVVTVPPVLLGLVALLRGARSSRAVARRLLVPALLLGPPVGAAVVSLLQPIYLVGRYELMAYPAWIVLWGIGVASLVPRGALLIGAGLALLALAAFVPSSVAYQTIEADDWTTRAAAEEMGRSPADEVFVAFGLARAPLEHQLRAIGDEHHLVSYPPDLETHPGWWKPASYENEELAAWAAALADGLSEQSALWLVIPLDAKGRPGPDRLLQPVFQALHAAGRRAGPPRTFGALGVLRFE